MEGPRKRKRDYRRRSESEADGDQRQEEQDSAKSVDEGRLGGSPGSSCQEKRQPQTFSQKENKSILDLILRLWLSSEEFHTQCANFRLTVVRCQYNCRVKTDRMDQREIEHRSISGRTE